MEELTKSYDNSLDSGIEKVQTTTSTGIMNHLREVLLSLNMKGWAKAGIDYVSIFDYFPNGIPTPKFVNKVAGMFTIFFGVLIVALLFASPFSSNIPAKLIAMVMWLSLLRFLINPLNVCLRRGRISLLFAMVHILLAPFTVLLCGCVVCWSAQQHCSSSAGYAVLSLLHH